MTESLRERLADLAHKQWSGWMRWMIHCLESPDRDTHLARWKRQMETPYAELPETEKESDRREADKVVAVLKASKCHHGEVMDCPECAWELKYLQGKGSL
jgi:predicted ester cyclase